MNEQLVAIGGQSLYPEYRGNKNMAMQDETAHRIAESGEGRKGSPAEIKRQGQGKRQKVEGKGHVREANDGQQKQEKVPLKEVWPLIRTVAALREERDATVSPKGKVSIDEGRGRVLISAEEVASIRKLLIDYGWLSSNVSLKEILENKRKIAELIVEAHELIKQAGVDKSQEEAWQYYGGLGRVLEEEMVEKAISRDEEVLTTGKVESLLEIEEFGEAAEGGGPGTMAAPDEIASLDPEAMAAKDSNLAIFVREMQRENGRPLPGPRVDKLEEIERAIDRAILEGRIKKDVVPADPEIERNLATVRRALENRIEVLARERRREELQERGLIDFNEHFGNDYKHTIAYIRVGDRDALRALMEAARAEVNKIDPAVDRIDPNKDTTWHGDVDVRKVFEVTRALKQEVTPLTKDRVQDIIGRDPDSIKLLEEFITKDRDVNLLERMSGFYRNIHSNLDNNTRKVIVGDIETNAQLATGSISQGWREINPRMKELFDTFRDTSKWMGADGRLTPRGVLREWRGLILIESVEKNIDLKEFAKPPPDWKDTPAALNKLIAYMEPTDLSVQDLQPTLQAAFGMLGEIDKDTEFGRQMFKELKEQLEAFKFKHSLVITAHIKSMNPEALKQVFDQDMEGTVEVTFQAMIARFERDVNGRRFYAKTRGADGLPLKSPERVNLFDVGKRLYSERLREDRIKMNMVEEMTKYSIENPFDEATKKKIREAVGYEYLSDEWKAKWDGELEATRQWLKARMEDKIAHEPKFGHLSLNNWGNEQDLKKGITKAVIRDWYERKTLHGAFGLIDEDGLNEVARELKDVFKKEGESDEGVTARIKKMFGEEATWYSVRRAEMRERIRNELAVMGLSHDPNVHFGEKGVPENLKDLSANDLDDLMETGYIGALETNVYGLTWVYEWSSYNIIHIYGRQKSKFDDDYKALVYNKSSDSYYGLVVDHNWEYLHEDFEDRGRGRENDVNDVFKQFFPGKHHWIFGHVSMAVRFIDSFLDERGQKLVDDRTDELVRKYNFHNKRYGNSFRNFMKGVAIRELMVAGAISFADRKYSDVVKEKETFTKFDPVDNADDRERLLKFLSAGALQSYLSNPEAEKFVKMTTKEELFPSTRDPRLFPWMEFGLRGHWEVVHNLKFKFFGEPDITNRQMENFVETLVGDGFVEKEEGEKFKREKLGMGPGILGRSFFRDVKSLIYDEEKRESQIQKKPLWLRLLLLLLLTLPLEVSKGLGKGALEEAKKQQ